MTLLYAAYGANTNIEHMAYRCPKAVPVGAARIFGWKLVFRGVADVVPDKKAEVWVGLWEITKDCEKALDQFEGFPNFYIKRDFVLTNEDGTKRRGMFYAMRQRDGQYAPYESYERTLRAGYSHFDMPTEQIDHAIYRAELADEQRRSSRIDLSNVDLLYPRFGRKWAKIDQSERRASKKARPKVGLLGADGKPLNPAKPGLMHAMA